MRAGRTRKGWWIVVVMVAIVAGVWIAVYVLQNGRLDRRGIRVPAGADHRPTLPIRVSLAPGEGLDGAALQRIATLLRSDQAFGRDVAFLLAASVRERCNPAHAGELAKMAGRARLPVLAATAEVTAQAPDLDRPIYRFVQRLSDAAPCGRVLDLEPTGLDLALDPEAYAAAFPDSYYRPALRTVPGEYGDQPLARRAQQGCQAVAYAVLPLGETNWQCMRVRASVRRRVLQVCEAERARLGDPGDSGEVPASMAPALTRPIAQLMEQLPQGCG